MMRMTAIATLGVALGMPTSALPAQTGPLAPVGKWKVDYADSMCVLSHVFGTGTSQVIVGFRPWPMGLSTEVVLMSSDSSGPASSYGKGTLSLSSAGPEIEGNYTSYWLPTEKVRLVTLTVEQAALADLGSARALSITISRNARVSVTLPSTFKMALKALDTCDDDLLRSWGVDPAEKAVIATPAWPFPGSDRWVTDDDYPPEALRNHQQGTVAMLWAIGRDGRVTNCVAVIKSGVPLLDQTACSAVTRRGRYHPALDKDGKPVISHSSRRVSWRLPS